MRSHPARDMPSGRLEREARKHHHNFLDRQVRQYSHPVHRAPPFSCSFRLTFSSYLDLYLSTDPSSAYYIGDKSVVIHSMNATRLTCANFAAVAVNSTSTTSATATLGATGAATSSAVVPAYTGAAARTVAGGFVGVIAMIMGFACL